MSLGPLLRASFAVAAFLGALNMVTWRQSRAYEALTRLDQIHRQTSVAMAERVDLERSVQVLESRARVVPAARARLHMHTPGSAELVILSGDLKP
jgi:hypothetical protein